SPPPSTPRTARRRPSQRQTASADAPIAPEAASTSVRRSNGSYGSDGADRPRRRARADTSPQNTGGEEALPPNLIIRPLGKLYQLGRLETANDPSQGWRPIVDPAEPDNWLYFATSDAAARGYWALKPPGTTGESAAEDGAPGRSPSRHRGSSNR